MTEFALRHLSNLALKGLACRQQGRPELNQNSDLGGRKQQRFNARSVNHCEPEEQQHVTYFTFTKLALTLVHAKEIKTLSSDSQVYTDD